MLEQYQGSSWYCLLSPTGAPAPLQGKDKQPMNGISGETLFLSRSLAKSHSSSRPSSSLKLLSFLNELF